uniref:Uncharacterized protein n=1 Tax=Chromera velia CCMP2878 TaxID=1169474 RepID=A0A0G4H4K0_9ALVE|eukprot:Cvel_24603.t1-p1 / transcript=Cvel_24603.t1 / gene=Cvel_24603 / organism=Chromera_velia_CCMP2878 / gene_product=hypothetical protein / transcript_product=hypothetical protein / location=Cvel_scaffold2680:7755-18992(+) / protein_length=2461 / sequence_SO=supercontig / SO=protein_coding / is_pseudo=false
MEESVDSALLRSAARIKESDLNWNVHASALTLEGARGARRPSVLREGGGSRRSEFHEEWLRTEQQQLCSLYSRNLSSDFDFGPSEAVIHLTNAPSSSSKDVPPTLDSGVGQATVPVSKEGGGLGLEAPAPTEGTRVDSPEVVRLVAYESVMISLLNEGHQREERTEGKEEGGSSLPPTAEAAAEHVRRFFGVSLEDHRVAVQSISLALDLLLAGGPEGHERLPEGERAGRMGEFAHAFWCAAETNGLSALRRVSASDIRFRLLCLLCTQGCWEGEGEAVKRFIRRQVAFVRSSVDSLVLPGALQEFHLAVLKLGEEAAREGKGEGEEHATVREGGTEGVNGNATRTLEDGTGSSFALRHSLEGEGGGQGPCPFPLVGGGGGLLGAPLSSAASASASGTSGCSLSASTAGGGGRGKKKSWARRCRALLEDKREAVRQISVMERHLLSETVYVHIPEERSPFQKMHRQQQRGQGQASMLPAHRSATVESGSSVAPPLNASAPEPRPAQQQQQSSSALFRSLPADRLRRPGTVSGGGALARQLVGRAVQAIERVLQRHCWRKGGDGVSDGICWPGKGPSLGLSETISECSEESAEEGAEKKEKSRPPSFFSLHPEKIFREMVGVALDASVGGRPLDGARDPGRSWVPSRRAFPLSVDLRLSLWFQILRMCLRMKSEEGCAGPLRGPVGKGTEGGSDSSLSCVGAQSKDAAVKREGSQVDLCPLSSLCSFRGTPDGLGHTLETNANLAIALLYRGVRIAASSLCEGLDPALCLLGAAAVWQESRILSSQAEEEIFDEQTIQRDRLRVSRILTRVCGLPSPPPPSESLSRIVPVSRLFIPSLILRYTLLLRLRDRVDQILAAPPSGRDVSGCRVRCLLRLRRETARAAAVALRQPASPTQAQCMSDAACSSHPPLHRASSSATSLSFVPSRLPLSVVDGGSGPLATALEWHTARPLSRVLAGSCRSAVAAVLGQGRVGRERENTPRDPASRVVALAARAASSMQSATEMVRAVTASLSFWLDSALSEAERTEDRRMSVVGGHEENEETERNKESEDGPHWFAARVVLADFLSPLLSGLQREHLTLLTEALDDSSAVFRLSEETAQALGSVGAAVSSLASAVDALFQRLSEACGEGDRAKVRELERRTSLNFRRASGVTSSQVASALYLSTSMEAGKVKRRRSSLVLSQAYSAKESQLFVNPLSISRRQSRGRVSAHPGESGVLSSAQMDAQGAARRTSLQAVSLQSAAVRAALSALNDDPSVEIEQSAVSSRLLTFGLAFWDFVSRLSFGRGGRTRRTRAGGVEEEDEEKEAVAALDDCQGAEGEGSAASLLLGLLENFCDAVCKIGRNAGSRVIKRIDKRGGSAEASGGIRRPGVPVASHAAEISVSLARSGLSQSLSECSPQLVASLSDVTQTLALLETAAGAPTFLERVQREVNDPLVSGLVEESCLRARGLSSLPSRLPLPVGQLWLEVPVGEEEVTGGQSRRRSFLGTLLGRRERGKNGKSRKGLYGSREGETSKPAQRARGEVANGRTGGSVRGDAKRQRRFSIEVGKRALQFPDSDALLFDASSSALFKSTAQSLVGSRGQQQHEGRRRLSEGRVEIDSLEGGAGGAAVGLPSFTASCVVGKRDGRERATDSVQGGRESTEQKLIRSARDICTLRHWVMEGGGSGGSLPPVLLSAETRETLEESLRKSLISLADGASLSLFFSSFHQPLQAAFSAAVRAPASGGFRAVETGVSEPSPRTSASAPPRNTCPPDRERLMAMLPDVRRPTVILTIDSPEKAAAAALRARETAAGVPSTAGQDGREGRGEENENSSLRSAGETGVRVSTGQGSNPRRLLSLYEEEREGEGEENRTLRDSRGSSHHLTPAQDGSRGLKSKSETCTENSHPQRALPSSLQSESREDTKVMEGNGQQERTQTASSGLWAPLLEFSRESAGSERSRERDGSLGVCQSREGEMMTMMRSPVGLWTEGFDGAASSRSQRGAATESERLERGLQVCVRGNSLGRSQSNEVSAGEGARSSRGVGASAEHNIWGEPAGVQSLVARSRSSSRGVGGELNDHCRGGGKEREREEMGVVGGCVLPVDGNDPCAAGPAETVGSPGPLSEGTLEGEGRRTTGSVLSEAGGAFPAAVAAFRSEIREFLSRHKISKTPPEFLSLLSNALWGLICRCATHFLLEPPAVDSSTLSEDGRRKKQNAKERGGRRRRRSSSSYAWGPDESGDDFLSGEAVEALALLLTKVKREITGQNAYLAGENNAAWNAEARWWRLVSAFKTKSDEELADSIHRALSELGLSGCPPGIETQSGRGAERRDDCEGERDLMGSLSRLLLRGSLAVSVSSVDASAAPRMSLGSSAPLVSESGNSGHRRAGQLEDKKMARGGQEEEREEKVIRQQRENGERRPGSSTRGRGECLDCEEEEGSVGGREKETMQILLESVHILYRRGGKSHEKLSAMFSEIRPVFANM